MFYFVEQPHDCIAIAKTNDGWEETDICVLSSEVLSLVVIFVEPPLKFGEENFSKIWCEL